MKNIKNEKNENHETLIILEGFSKKRTAYLNSADLLTSADPSGRYPLPKTKTSEIPDTQYPPLNTLHPVSYTQYPLWP